MNSFNKSLLFLCILFFAELSLAQSSALIIIDMQSRFFTRSEGRHDTTNIKKYNNVIQRQVELIQTVKVDFLSLLWEEQ